MIRVDTNQPAGKIRRLHGTNLSAPMARGAEVIRDLQELRIPQTRLHDAPLENPGMRLVDISMVFPRFDADPQDPANYYFAQTDDYIANCLACADRVSYRLGESIEHTPKQYAVVPPTDYDRWADICINIIRHYNEGWADGFHYNLDHWHIWEEPDNIPRLWAGTWEEFIRLYVIAARKIKQRFPQLKVGGCAMRDATGWEAPGARARLTQFLQACRNQQAPLDFFTWTCYTDSMERVLREPITLRAELDAHGFSRTELHLAEWHYIPEACWGDLFGEPELRKRAWETVNGLESAAFLCATLAGLQDAPIDMASYYTGSTLRWGFYDLHGARNKCYYAMKAFSLLAACEDRMAVHVPKDEPGLWVLAGRMENGRVVVMVSCLQVPACPITIMFGGGIDARNVRVRAIDAGRNLDPLPTVRSDRSGVTLDKPAGAAVYLVEVSCEACAPDDAPVMKVQAPTRVSNGFFDATPLLRDPAALRRRADEDGFLFFRQFLPVEPLLELRRQILEIVNRHGWILPGSDLMDALADPVAVAAADARDPSLRAIGVSRDAYREIQRLELFHELPHHPRLLQLYRDLFQSDVLPHPRHIARVLLPAPSFAPTAPHQDYLYIHGTHRFWTCWYPLGDVPLELGGLSVLRGSHREPVLDVMRGPGAGGLEAILCGKDYAWVQDAYRCGDLITFPSHMVHKGLPNRLGNRIRLSCDIRYQPEDEEVDKNSLQPHLNVAAWDDLYAGWHNRAIQYYWRKRSLHITETTLPVVDVKERRPC